MAAGDTRTGTGRRRVADVGPVPDWQSNTLTCNKLPPPEKFLKQMKN